MKRIIVTLSTVMMLAALGIWAAAAWGSGKAQLREGVEPTDCRACHESPVLPDNHPDVKEEKNSDCTQCHQPHTDSSLRGKITLSHTHLAAGVSCAGCHGEERPFKNVGTSKCRECHGDPNQVEALTKGLPVNPHTSPHYGNELDCDLCHHLHYQSENTCNQCHEHSGLTP